jgi:integrase/recombinase XerD
MLHETMLDFFRRMELAGKHETVRGYRTGLTQYAAWLARQRLDPLQATTEHIRAFQRFLAEDYRSPDGAPLVRSTQVTRLSAVKSYYVWLARRGLILLDVSRKVKLPHIPRGMVRKDYLTLQEVTALLQTQARHCQKYSEGSYRWARECRDLALLCVAFASGRRRKGLRNLKVQDLNFERNELRCEREKGKAGRVLPICAWAMAIAKLYLAKARPVLDWRGDNDWLFVGERSPKVGNETFSQLLRRVQRQTVELDPDLQDLARKRLTPHSLRVSFATILFSGGCNIRSINELMMHEHLSTTARYTPIPLEDLRRVCRMAHPRA